LRLEEVVANLLDNAVKYSPAPAPVEVEVAGTDHEVRIAVRDHGPGVPPAEREKIFEPFHRGETGLPGVGLGLGGSLSLDGPPDGGARFVVSVPRDGNGRQEMRGPQAAPRRDA
ncbi:MAG: sensor histidine kinase, partial [Chloroflexi bacterium]